jgi:hypothetical protein
VLSLRSQARAVFRIDEDSDDADNEQKGSRNEEDLNGQIGLVLGEKETQRPAGVVPYERSASKGEQQGRRTLTPRSQARAVYIIHPDPGDSSDDSSDSDKPGGGRESHSRDRSLLNSAGARPSPPSKQDDKPDELAGIRSHRSQTRALYDILGGSDDSADGNGEMNAGDVENQHSVKPRRSVNAESMNDRAGAMGALAPTASQRRAVYDIGEDSDASKEEKESAPDRGDSQISPPPARVLSIALNEPGSRLDDLDASSDSAGDMSMRGKRTAEEEVAGRALPVPRTSSVPAVGDNALFGELPGGKVGTVRPHSSDATTPAAPVAGPPASTPFPPAATFSTAGSALGVNELPGLAAQAMRDAQGPIPVPRSHFDLADSDNSSAEDAHSDLVVIRRAGQGALPHHDQASLAASLSSADLPSGATAPPLQGSVYDIGDSDSD